MFTESYIKKCVKYQEQIWYLVFNGRIGGFNGLNQGKYHMMWTNMLLPGDYIVHKDMLPRVFQIINTSGQTITCLDIDRNIQMSFPSDKCILIPSEEDLLNWCEKTGRNYTFMKGKGAESLLDLLILNEKWENQ